MMMHAALFWFSGYELLLILSGVEIVANCGENFSMFATIKHKHSPSETQGSWEHFPLEIITPVLK